VTRRGRLWYKFGVTQFEARTGTSKNGGALRPSGYVVEPIPRSAPDSE